MQFRGMEFPAQIALQFGRALAEAHGAQPALGGRNQQAPQGRWDNREANARARAAAAIFARRHAKLLRRSLVQPARRSVTRVIQRGGYVVAVAQAGFHLLYPARGLVLAWAEAGGALEQALQVEGTETDAAA